MGSLFRHLALLVVAETFLLERNQARLIVTPSDQSVIFGDEVRFNCSTDDSDGITWKFLYTGGNNPIPIFTGGRFINGHAQRFRIERSYDLILGEAQLDDDGEFFCVDEDGRGETARARLVVEEIKLPFLKLPENKTVMRGQHVTFNCWSAYYRNVYWTRKALGSGKESPIYYGDLGLVNGYKTGGRHSVNPDDFTGRYDLHIESVRMDDAGKYFCIDESGIGNKVMAELTVIESAPDCSSSVPSEEVFGGSACGIHDNIVMSCKVGYKGNIPPVLKWRRSKDSNPNRLGNWEKETTITNSSVVSTVTFEADGAVNTYTCQADISDTSASSCTKTTEFIKRLFISNVTKFETIAKSQSVSCTADTSQPCSYSWIRDEASSKTTVVEDRVLHLKDAGRYWCKAECTVRSTTCIVYPLAIHFTNDEDGDPYVAMVTIPLVCFLAGVSIAAAVVAVAVFVMRRKTRSNPALVHKRGISTSQSNVGSGANSFEPANERNTVIHEIFNIKYRMKGIAVLGDKLYAIFENHDTMRVHDTNPPFNVKKKIRVPGMKTPEDITACSESNALFVTDSTIRCVWKIPIGKGNPGKFIENIEPPYTISVTELGRIILVKEKKQESESSIEMYTANGHLDKSLTLKSSAESMRHAVLTKDDRYVVSFGGRIGLVDKLGNILKSYPTIDDPGFTTPTEPWRIFMENGSTYLAYFQNHKIIVLDGNFVETSAYQLPKLDDHRKYMQNYIVGPTHFCVCLSTGEILVQNFPITTEDFKIAARHQSGMDVNQDQETAQLLQPRVKIDVECDHVIATGRNASL